MSEIDVVARVSDRICEHMNLDHASAVLHLSMHHARLALLPRWAKMEAIAATRMVIRYAERTNTAPASSDADLPTVEVLFDPPLQSTLDARERLVFLSAEAEQQNQQRAVQVGGTIDLLLTQNAPQEWCDRITLDLIVMRFNTFVTGAYASRATDTDPLTWFMLAILLTMARQYVPWIGSAVHGPMPRLFRRTGRRFGCGHGAQLCEEHCLDLKMRSGRRRGS